MRSRGTSKRSRPRIEPEIQATVTWQIQKTIEAESVADLQQKTDAVTRKLELEFESVDLQDEEDLRDDDDEDDDEDEDDTPDGELDFDDD